MVICFLPNLILATLSFLSAASIFASCLSTGEAVKTPRAPVANRGSQLCACAAVGVCSADSRWLNKAKSPADSSSFGRIRINSQDVAPVSAQDMTDRQCSKVGPGISIHSSHFNSY